MSALGTDEVHVWCASLELLRPRMRDLQCTLTAEELERAERYRFQRDRERSIAARGLLRVLLGRYLDAAPDGLCFAYGPYGKPRLAGEYHGAAWCFNLAHSHELILCAVSRDRELGIDVEHIRPTLVDEGLAERYFSSQEVAALRAAPETARARAFFACWTRKEAYLKARGEGLAGRFDRPVHGSSITDDSQEISRWSLLDLDLGPDYAATLCVEGEGWQSRCFEWRGWPCASVERTAARR